MLRKSTLFALSLLISIMPLCSALAAEKKLAPVFDEQQILKSIIEQVPLYAAASKNIQSGSQRPCADISQNPAKLFDVLASHDKEFSLLIDTMRAKNIITMPAQEFKQMTMKYLQEISTFDLLVIAPGCLTPYAVSAITLLTYTPAAFILFLNELINTTDTSCSIMYGSWFISGIGFALSTWTAYRLCAEENAAIPNQDIIAELQGDRAAMQLVTLASLGIGLVYSWDCSDRFLDWGNNNKKK